MKLPTHVTVCEVAPRDGFQAIHEWIPTEKKVEIVKMLASTGLTSMEITSFVHPKAIPQLRDAEEVVRAMQDQQEIKLRALVPNVRGAARAIDVGIKKLKLMLSATDSHSLSNSNCLVKDALEGMKPIIELAQKHDVAVGGSISVAFGCPFEGKVPLEKICSIIEHYQSLGIHEVSLADSTGVANPQQVDHMLGVLVKQFSSVTFSMHLHNTRGMALANAVAALQQGIVHFDSSIAGLGGCPYLPGATGNIATEDLIHAFEQMGVRTGVNEARLLAVARQVKDMIGYDGGSFLLQAGPCSQLHQKPTSQQKLG
ncbi:hydroxymethylglutaryl-CoA lyase [Brevibacillus sp. TJ4]|uniref:hydroxymethylglutaryl-CoA lyase n=1 Tax=Brevibacillus sp. TJ4 TaxID=3234853 RepID=UPI0037D5480E